MSHVATCPSFLAGKWLPPTESQMTRCLWKGLQMGESGDGLVDIVDLPPCLRGTRKLKVKRAAVKAGSLIISGSCFLIVLLKVPLSWQQRRHLRGSGT